jgi:succinate dehydrogenase / fumarate reductase iron-sulfur subunit
MIIESSDQVPRTTLFKRFPVPKNFGLAPQSRIGPGKTWLAQGACHAGALALVGRAS